MIGTIERPSFVMIMVCRFLCNETLGTFRQLLSESRTRTLNKRAIAKWKWRHYFFCINDTFEIFKNNYYRFCKNLQKQYLPFTLFIVCNVKCRNFGEFTSLPNLVCLFTVFLCSQSDTHVCNVCNMCAPRARSLGTEDVFPVRGVRSWGWRRLDTDTGHAAQQYLHCHIYICMVCREGSWENVEFQYI